FLPMWCKTLANVPVLKESCLEDITRWFRQEGKRIMHKNLEQHLAKMKSITDTWWGNDIDFHLSPTVTCLAPKSESPLNETREQMLARMVPLGAYTALSNVMGYAAVTLPVGSSQSGLPIGIQLMAPQGNDAVLLQLAQEI
ncbi:MAG: amidase family protein, partial [Myxococcaceae bacterium]